MHVLDALCPRPRQVHSVPSQPGVSSLEVWGKQSDVAHRIKIKLCDERMSNCKSLCK